MCTRGRGAHVEELADPQVHMHPARMQHVDVEAAQPVQPGREVAGVGTARLRRAVGTQPGGCE